MTQSYLSGGVPMTVDDVFAQALGKSTPAERTAYLDDVCADDLTMRQRVETLLQAHEAAGDFLEKPAIQCAAEALAGPARAEDTQAERPGDDEDQEPLTFLAPSDKPDSLGRLGHYEVLESIGRGGMGIVLRAFDEKLHRVVAIKVMAAQLATNANARKRFTREAQAAAAVTHDHIVGIHAVEETNGLPYLVMQYVSGMSLQQRLDSHGPLELREIVRIGMQTATGLAAAHAHGLIHRDIKPANILLENGVERVKVTDFGLARAVADASLTQSGVVAGTPQYMSPEQARGEGVDQRTDLFSLGSVLYAMCTGRPPFRADSNMAVLKRVCDNTPSAIRETHPEIPDWLVAIVHKLHAKNSAERFQSAAEVAELLKDHLAHLQHPSVVGPVAGNLPSPSGRQAGSEGVLLPSPSERGAGGEGAPRRRRWPLAAAALLMCLIGGLGFTEATGVTTLVATVSRIFMPEEESVTIARGDKQVNVRLEPAWQAKATPPEQPLAPGEVRRFVGHTLPAHSIAISKDGSKVLSGGRDKTLRLWDVATGKETRRFEGHSHFVAAVALSPDGRRAVSSGAYTDRTILLWDVETGTELPFFDLHSGTTVVFSPDGGCILFDDRGILRLCDVKTGKELCRFEGHTEECWGLAFSADGRRILSGSEDKTMRLWEVETGKELRCFGGHNAFVLSVAFSADGRHALSGGGDGTMRLWDVDSGQELRRFEVHDGEVQSVAFSPDGRYALSGSGIVRLWDVQTGKVLRRFTGHTSVIAKVAFTPDGRHALSAGWDGDNTLRLWQLPEPASAVKDFAVLGGTGVAERTYDTLAEAVLGASDGDTIEVRGNGPFVTEPVEIHAGTLTIRAAPGFRPVIRLSQQAALTFEPMLSARGDALVLEGLEFQRLGQREYTRGEKAPVVISTRTAALHIANCRFRLAGARYSRCVDCFTTVRLRNCEFLGFAYGVEGGGVTGSSRVYVLENCVQVGGVALTVPPGAEVRLTRNTLVSPDHLLMLPVQFPPEELEKYWGAGPARVEASANVLDGRVLLMFLHHTASLAGGAAPEPADAEVMLRRMLTWRDRGNLYRAGATSVFWCIESAVPRATFPLAGKAPADWKRLWNDPQAELTEGQLRYQGGDLLARARTAPDHLSPEDFRLRSDSAGYRAGKDGKDLGADVDLVGPGPAYERWKKTPEYQQWLKDSGR